MAGRKVTADVMDWKQERLEADSLLRSLYEDHCEDEKHRKWLLRRWPEWREGRNESLPDPERFIPEWYLRDGEDDVSESLKAIQKLVTESSSILEREEEKDGQLHIPGMVAKLSDEGVLESIPLLLPKLKRKALQSILSTLSGLKREARNRHWLIEKINKDWLTFAGYSEFNAATRKMQKIRKILEVFRDPDSFPQEPPPQQLSLEETSCPWSAARSALNAIQLEQLPIPCLHVMLEVLLEKPPEVMIGKLPVGGNKERLVTSLLEKGRALLSDGQAGEALPESLRKSLVVMSVAARYAFGVDDNLIDFLGPIPLDMQLLQANLLSAISDLKILNYENLRHVHRILIGAPKAFRKKHPVNLRSPVKRILLDCLLRSEVRPVPKKVKTAARTIQTLATKQLGENGQHVSDSRFEEHPGGAMRIGLEVESTLRISSHLQQIMRNWREILSRSSQEEFQRISLRSAVTNCSSAYDIGTSYMTEATPRISLGKYIEARNDVIREGRESLAASMKDGGIEDIRSQLENNYFDNVALVAHREWTNTTMSVRPDDSETVEIDGTAEAVEDLHLTNIADEAAEVGYALVGCSLERTARSSGVSLKRPVRKYLRSGTMRKVRTDPGEGMNAEQHQLAMILKIAEKIPAISPRVIDNVKKRLGMG